MTPEERALLADLKMYSKADKTRVRDHEFKKIDDKRTPEIGPVDPDLKLEEPDYEIPWSGKIDENKKVLGNATETAKLALGDFDDTYLPDEVKRIGNVLSSIPVDPAAAGKAIIFPSVAAEKAFMKKFLKDLDPKEAKRGIESHMKHTDKARDELTTAYYRNMQDGVYPHADKNKNSSIVNGYDDIKAEWDVNDNGNDDVFTVVRESKSPNAFILNADGNSSLDHEGLHDYALQAGIQSRNKGYYSGPMKGYPQFTTEREITGIDINSGRPEYREVVDNSAIGNMGRQLVQMSPTQQTNEFLNVMYDELMKYPSFRKMSAEKQDYVMGLLGDGLSMDNSYELLTKDGRRRVEGYAAHARNYPKESAEHGVSAADVEMAANLNEGFADPEVGRLLKEMGINNENFLYPVHLESSDIDVPTLVEQLKKEGYYDEADNLVPTKRKYKVKYGGPEYQKMLAENAEGNPERLDAALEAGDIGDRWGATTTFDVSKDLASNKGAFDKSMWEDAMRTAGIPRGLFPRVLRDNLMPKIHSGQLKTTEEIQDYLNRLAPALKEAWGLK